MTDADDEARMRAALGVVDPVVAGRRKAEIAKRFGHDLPVRVTVSRTEHRRDFDQREVRFNIVEVRSDGSARTVLCSTDAKQARAVLDKFQSLDIPITVIPDIP
jgi:hypothetical protein